MTIIVYLLALLNAHGFQRQVGFPGGSDGEESACNAGDLGWEDPLEKGMATHSNVLDQRIPWTEEPGKLQFVGCKELDTTE